jgi:ribonuclease BN (tRNA processing enzyme)
MLEVTFLGVGAAIPAPGQTNCAYLVRAGASALLIDCGPAVLQQLAGVGLTPGDVTHLFVTHRHGDHALGYPMFRLWWGLEGKHSGKPPPTVVASSVTCGALRTLWEQTYQEIPGQGFPEVELSDEPSCHPLTDEVTLLTRPLPHSGFAPVLGVRVEVSGKALAFTGDTAASDEVVQLAYGADLLVCDARYAATVEPARPGGTPYHCTALDAGKYAAEARAKALALVHIGAEYRGREAELVAEARRGFGGDVFAPADGDVFRLEGGG